MRDKVSGSKGSKCLGTWEIGIVRGLGEARPGELWRRFKHAPTDLKKNINRKQSKKDNKLKRKFV